jgi:hypothetical protein
MTKKEEIKNKASLSWTKDDYELTGDEAPECVYFGKTEGELLEDEDIVGWIEEETRALKVLREEFPKRFEEQYRYFTLDLEYLLSLGKISAEDMDSFKDKGNFSFGK